MSTGRSTLNPDDDLTALRLREDRRLSLALFWAVFAGIILLSVMDVRIAGSEPGRLVLLLAFRAVWALVTLVSIRAIRTARDRGTLDRRTTTGLVVLLGAILALSLLRPPESYTVNRLQVMTVFLAYGGLPLPPRRVVLTMLTFTGGCVLVLLFYNVGVPPVERDSIIIAFVLSHVIGYVIARRRARLVENEAVIWRANAEARRQLAQTLAEVRTLEGLLPICAHCHRIRAEDGNWERLERYVTAHSEAQFSHGVCPECMQKHYPE